MKKICVFNTTSICVLLFVLSSLDATVAAIGFFEKLDSHLGVDSGIPVGTHFSGFTDNITAKDRVDYSGIDQLNSVQLSTTATPSISGKFTGTWYDPTHDGEGFSIEIIDGNGAVIYWFTYDDYGNQVWIVGIGAINGNTISVSDAIITNGGVFGSGFNPADVIRKRWGSLSFTFSDCNNAVMDYEGPPEFGTGTLFVQRLTSITGILCDQTLQVENQFAGLGRITGLWYDPSHNGEGFLIEVFDDNSALIYWYTYDSHGNQAWILGAGTVAGRIITIESSTFTQGGIFGPEFNPNTIERMEWGRMIFRFPSCSTGIVQYESSAGFGSGTLELIRLTSIDNYLCNVQAVIDLNGENTGTSFVTLDWVAPVLRVDGTALAITEISEYTIYYGTLEGVYSDSFTISADFETSVTITGLQAGTYYYLAITARDTDGLESGYLPIAKKLAR